MEVLQSIYRNPAIHQACDSSGRDTYSSAPHNSKPRCVSDCRNLEEVVSFATNDLYNACVQEKRSDKCSEQQLCFQVPEAHTSDQDVRVKNHQS